jgi:hypothetical protein
LGPGVGSEVPAEETGAGGALSALWGGIGRGVETGILGAVGKEEKGVGVGTGLAVGLGVAEGPGEAAKNSGARSTATRTNAAMANALIIRF